MRALATEIGGVWPMLYSFFGSDGGPDRPAMRRQIEACVAGGAAGVACLGLAGEVGKLDTAERREIAETLAEALAGRLPFAVTIADASVPAQIASARHAMELGAAFVILQPAPVAGLAEIEHQRFFGRVLDATDGPIAIQNAAAYIGTALSAPALLALRRQHANLAILKAEAPAVEIAGLIEATEGAFAVLNGRGGLELVDNLRAGCVGMVPCPDCFERQVAVLAAFARGDEDEAERLYAEIAPAIVFAMQSIPHLLCYGKRLTALRLGLEAVHDRAPSMTPTAFGLEATRRFARALGPLPG